MTKITNFSDCGYLRQPYFYLTFPRQGPVGRDTPPADSGRMQRDL